MSEVGNEAENRLDKLKRALYDRRRLLPPLRRSRLVSAPESKAGDWRRVEPLTLASRLPSFPKLKKWFWLALGFFGLMLVVALLILYGGRNIVSAGSVAIQVSGPLTVAAGQELNLQVTVTNNNHTRLELADLLVEYPSGTRAASGGAALARERIPLGTIVAGASVRHLIRAVLFGEKGNRSHLVLGLEYRLPDSGAIFSKESGYDVAISSTPLTLLLAVPREVNSGQDIVARVEVVSNSETAIDSPALVLAYPAGFRFVSAVPPPTRGQNIWQLNTLKTGERRLVEIRGTLNGEDDEQKSFRAAAGVLAGESTGDLTATYGSVFETLIIKRPFVNLGLALNGNDSGDYLATSRETIRADLAWVNNLPGEIKNAQVLVELNGRALDQTSVLAERGFYNSAKNTLLWSKSGVPELASLAPDNEGQVSFDFSLLSLVDDLGASLRQPTLDLTVKFSGQRIDDNGQAAPVYAEWKRQIKLNSEMQLAGKVLQRTGPFVNQGPLPPQVGAETTYTIVWSVLNSSNTLSGTTVTATLPPYMRWLGATAPSGETVSFRPGDGGGGQVIWNLSQVAPGTGTSAAARELAFQVALQPSVSQVGIVPELMTDSVLTGVDTFTKATLTANLKRALTTELTTEPSVNQNQDHVVQ